MTNVHLEELMVKVVEFSVGGSATVVEMIQMRSKTASTTSLLIVIIIAVMVMNTNKITKK